MKPVKRLACVAVLLSASGIAWAAPPIEEGYEVQLTNLTLPTSEFGNVIFRSCDECDPIALRVDADTVYYLGKQALPLAEFRSAVLALQDRDKSGATVIRRLDSGKASRVYVWPAS